MNTTSFVSEMLQTITDRGRRLLSHGHREDGGDPVGFMANLCDWLLSSRGEASGMAYAADILDRWQHLDEDGQNAFLRKLATGFGPDMERLTQAVSAYAEHSDARTLQNLHRSSEPRRQELIRRLNLAPGGTAALVSIRETLLKTKGADPDLNALDADFAHLFSSWFNRGFLVLRTIDWSTPANILEKIIRYEAVHDIDGWDQLRLRLVPEDRRCFAFFHPQLTDDPLIFVEVALTRDIPAEIEGLLSGDRKPIPAGEATTAVFYSISNCQKGLRGISFGNFLIKQVVEDLRRALPKLETFVTLSPVPGFAAWLESERNTEDDAMISDADKETLGILDEPDWQDDAEKVAEVAPSISAAAAAYFLKARDAKGRVIDPVARFHLGNGARLERINFLADHAPKALSLSHGLMVNYLYKLDDIEENHEIFAGRGEVIASPAVKRMESSHRGHRHPASTREKAG